MPPAMLHELLTSQVFPKVRKAGSMIEQGFSSMTVPLTAHAAGL